MMKAPTSSASLQDVEGTAYGMGIRPWGALVRSKVRKLHGPVAQVINLFFVEEADFLDFGEYTGNNNGVECSAHFKEKKTNFVSLETISSRCHFFFP